MIDANMSDMEEVKQTGDHEAEGDQGCPVVMDHGRRCGRAIYNAPAGIDKTPVCLMHSHDRNKDDGAFQAEFDRILKEAGEGVADFTHFVFPSANYRSRKFSAMCLFVEATFTQDANFFEATFMQDTIFREATFTQNAYFGRATFTQVASFYQARFMQYAGFGSATFSLGAMFFEAKFRQAAYFHEATFTQFAIFSRARFTQGVEFSEARFSEDASFSWATFTQDADFSRAWFARDADFSRATFTQDADFSCATFTRDAYFSGARFCQDAYFNSAVFMHNVYFNVTRGVRAGVRDKNDVPERFPFVPTIFERKADFRDATFSERAEFRQTQFREDGMAEPGPVFGLARFDRPDLVIFYDTYLGQALFHNCDVSEFLFTKVRWRQRDNGKRMVFDEEQQLKLDRAETVALFPEAGGPDKRNYRLIAELYQQLKKNYDDRGNYGTAEDFHYGEMEMKRLACPRLTWFAWLGAKLSGKPRLRKVGGWCAKLQSSTWLLSKVRWWHQRLGLAAWYRRASDYGESWGRPLLWLFALLVLFAALYPLLGLRPAAGKSRAARTTAVQVETPSPQETDLRYWNYERPGRLFWHGAMTSLDIAALQRDFAYEPSYPWGRLLALLELLLTSTLIALFLLAVRRQFRR
jgi:hypothetical protein